MTNAPSLLGYTDRLGVRPGERVSVHVSASAGAYRASIAPLDDRAGADAWGAAADLGTHRARRREIALGSCVRVAGARRAGPLLADEWTIAVWAFPTRPARGRPQGVIALHGEDDRDRALLTLDGDGIPSFALWHEGRPLVELRGREPLPAKVWTRLVVTRAGDGRVRLRQVPQSTWQRPAAADAELPDHPPLAFDAVTIGDAFNGKLSDPCVLRRALGEAEACDGAAALERFGAAERATVAAWLLGPTLAGGVEVRDLGPHGLHGTAVNAPDRAVTGPGWTGREIDHRRAPGEYRALQLHEDDLEDAGWAADFELTVPEDCPSGVHGVRLEGDDGEHDVLPLIVLPREPAARIAVVLPVLTYLAYANQNWWSTEGDAAIRYSLLDEPCPTRCDALLRAHPEVGRSLYDFHADGTPVQIVTRRRPLLSVRDDYLGNLTGRPRHFSADLRFLRWLRARGWAFDVLTDEDLHADPTQLRRYRAVVTGGHPEYLTEHAYDAFDLFVREGGRLAYLGGNGFFWVTGIDPDRPHLIEVRRGHGGLSPLGDGAAGEDHLATTGEPGGLWSLRGRAAQRLTGIGSRGMGWGRGGGYGWTEAARAPEVAELVAGIDLAQPFGDPGEAGLGAASDEFDATDPALGTPAQTLVLATSLGRHPDPERYYVVPPGGHVHEDGEDRLCSEVTYLPPAGGGGAVFAAGSIDWTAAARHDEVVARLTENVLRTFEDG